MAETLEHDCRWRTPPVDEWHLWERRPGPGRAAGGVEAQGMTPTDIITTKSGLRFLSVCSGIEAASVAWGPLGWQAVGFSEIEPFPCAVLAHHYPDVRNYGDLTRWEEWIGDVADFDVLAGGTPCQGFSVAGRRGGLDDPRSQLAFDFLGIARSRQPRWVFWENVPGVLSSGGGRDFGAFIGELGKCGYGFAYRVLDAQYFGLAQRRKRVFVVGYLGDWRPAAAVLLEPESLRGDSPPSRETGEGTARDVAASLRSGGCGTSRVGDTRRQDNVVPFTIHGTDKTQKIASETDCAGSLRTKPPGSQENSSTTVVAHSLRAEGHDASEDGTGRGVPLVADVVDVAPTIRSGGNRTGGDRPPGTDVDTADSLIPCAMNLRGREGGAMPELDDVASIRAASGGSSRSYAFAQNQRGELRESDVSPQLTTGGGKPGEGYPAVRSAMAVRRLTPKECARLQGFPDTYLDIIYRGKPAADGPKYKALGNSWAVPVVRWIGERMAAAQGRLFV